MAESLQVGLLEHTPTCSICLGVFTEPVTLPCKHSYCRECLQVFADKWKENTESISKQSGGEIVIPCPQCRAATDLGTEGVAGLSVDTGGAMKHHNLIPMEEYLSKMSPECPESGSVERTPSCDLHKQKYTIYCITCQTVICTGCLVDHNEHSVSDIHTACENLKAPLQKKTQEFEKLQFELQESLAGLTDLQADIEVIKELNISLDDQMGETRNSIQKQKDVKNMLQSEIELHPVVSRELQVTETSREQVRRVVHEGWDLDSNPDTTSWWIVMRYSYNKVSCYRSSNCRVDITSGYDEPIRHTGPYRLGFSLNCEECTLTVTDIGNNRIMATVRDIDLSQPVIPAVKFYCWSQCSVSARLFHWVSST